MEFKITPKQKAEELFYNVYAQLLRVKGLSREDCLMITSMQIEKCIEVHNMLDGEQCGIKESFKFWNEVKEEFNKL
jgi:hypothetical protein